MDIQMPDVFSSINAKKAGIFLNDPHIQVAKEFRPIRLNLSWEFNDIIEYLPLYNLLLKMDV